MFGLSSFSQSPFCTLPTLIQIYVVSVGESGSATDTVSEVERKKVGFRKARRRKQFSKR